MASGDEPGGRTAEIFLTSMNFGPLPRAEGFTRLEARFTSRSDHVSSLAQRVGDPGCAAEAAKLGLVTEAVPPANGKAGRAGDRGAEPLD